MFCSAKEGCKSPPTYNPWVQVREGKGIFTHSQRRKESGRDCVSLPPRAAQRLQDRTLVALHKPQLASVSVLSALAKPRLPTCNLRTLVSTPTEVH